MDPQKLEAVAAALAQASKEGDKILSLQLLLSVPMTQRLGVAQRAAQLGGNAALITLVLPGAALVVPPPPSKSIFSSGLFWLATGFLGGGIVMAIRARRGAPRVKTQLRDDDWDDELDVDAA